MYVHLNYLLNLIIELCVGYIVTSIIHKMAKLQVNCALMVHVHACTSFYYSGSCDTVL